jgi:hypothetical protein
MDYTEIELNHIVLFERDNTVFAAGREKASNHIRIFLINERTGNVYSRNGRADSWEEVYGENRATLINSIYSAKNALQIPVYKLSSMAA